MEIQRKEKRDLSTEVQKKDIKDLPKTKNIAGPAVYYPPNHEMFAHKEESGGYRAEVMFQLQNNILFYSNSVFYILRTEAVFLFEFPKNY